MTDLAASLWDARGKSFAPIRAQVAHRKRAIAPCYSFFSTSASRIHAMARPSAGPSGRRAERPPHSRQGFRPRLMNLLSASVSRPLRQRLGKSSPLPDSISSPSLKRGFRSHTFVTPGSRILTGKRPLRPLRARCDISRRRVSLSFLIRLSIFHYIFYGNHRQGLDRSSRPPACPRGDLAPRAGSCFEDGAGSFISFSPPSSLRCSHQAQQNHAPFRPLFSPAVHPAHAIQGRT